MIDPNIQCEEAKSCKYKLKICLSKFNCYCVNFSYCYKYGDIDYILKQMAKTILLSPRVSLALNFLSPVDEYLRERIAGRAMEARRKFSFSSWKTYNSFKHITRSWCSILVSVCSLSQGTLVCLYIINLVKIFKILICT